MIPSHTDPARVVAVLGTNASGKSSLGVALAQRFNGEVISADSRQVYRRLQLGAGKLTTDEMAGVRHHLIDVIDVDKEYSVADYQADAYAAIDDIVTRGKLPIVVGGTGLYLDAVLSGYELVGAAPDPERRAELEALGVQELVGLLRLRDPDAAGRVDVKNRRRLIRAVEIADAGFAYGETRRRAPRYVTLKLGLTWPQEILDRRIGERLRRRLDRGMVDEGRELLGSGVTAERLDQLGLEYRYIARYLNGEYPSEAVFVEELERAIRRFARRQLSWFRREPEIVWLHPEAGNYLAEAVNLVEDFVPER